MLCKSEQYHKCQQQHKTGCKAVFRLFVSLEQRNSFPSVVKFYWWKWEGAEYYGNPRILQLFKYSQFLFCTDFKLVSIKNLKGTHHLQQAFISAAGMAEDHGFTHQDCIELQDWTEVCLKSTFNWDFKSKTLPTKKLNLLVLDKNPY